MGESGQGFSLRKAVGFGLTAFGALAAYETARRCCGVFHPPTKESRDWPWLGLGFAAALIGLCVAAWRSPAAARERRGASREGELGPAYLRELVRSVLVDHLRRESRRRHWRIGLHKAVRRGARNDLEDCFSRLSRKRLTALKLSMEGHSIEDVAEKLGIDGFKKAANLILRARADLRDCLKKRAGRQVR